MYDSPSSIKLSNSFIIIALRCVMKLHLTKSHTRRASPFASARVLGRRAGMVGCGMLVACLSFI